MAEKNLIKNEYLKILKKSFSEQSGFSNYKEEIEKYRSRSKLENMNSFYDLILNRKAIFEKGGKPLVGYFCNFVPEEIILALDAIPVRLCSADYPCAQKGEEIVSAEVCPLTKSICGDLQSPEYKNLDLVVVPSACDSKTKLAEILSPFKEIYFLDIFRDSDYLKNVNFWTQKYIQFYEFLKDRFKKKIELKELLDACSKTNKRTEIFRKIYSFRIQNPGIINSYDYFTMAYASFFTDPGTWSEYAQKVYEEALKIKEEKQSSYLDNPRILLSGSALIFPNFKILEILEELNCCVCADTLCTAYGRMYDPIVIDEELESEIIRALSLKYISASMCPCLLSINKLLDRILEIVKENKLDGVIYYNLRLCQVFEMESPIIRRILKENKIPFLFLKTDLGKEDTGQLKTRVEAFFEMLKK